MRLLVAVLSLSLLASAALAADRVFIRNGPLTADQKIHSSAFREAARGRAWAAVRVYFHDDVAFETARSAILSSGGALSDIFATEYAPMRFVSAKIPPYALRTLAGDDRVLFVAGPRRFRLKTDNVTSAAVSHVTEVQAAPYGLTGKGVAVSLFELAEAQGTHVEFGGRLNVLASGGFSEHRQHATHVAGTIAASGVRAEAKGMAPSATLYQFRVTLGPNDEALYHTPKDQQLASRGVVVDNNSWGFVIAWAGGTDQYLVWVDNEEYFGGYDYEFTAPLDQISRDRGVLFVHSAGNEADDGPGGAWNAHRHLTDEGDINTTQLFCYSKNASGTDCDATCGVCETAKHHAIAPFDTLSMTGAGKNVLTVGAVDTSHGLMALSSRGPAKDGRVKPEVVARGSNVLSSIPTNSYAIANGTSMAAPVVTGVAALVAEQWQRTFATSPKPEELKAVIIAGADDLGAAGPDYSYGFGLVNAKSSIDLVIADHADHKHIRSTTITQGQQYEMPIVVESAKNVRVVLQWPDPPIFLSEEEVYTAKALVNDLDLRIVGPTGTTYLPYVLDKTNFTAAATRGVNTVDNTEMVEIANAQPGTYRVIVSGTNVPQGPQNAVLVTTARGARPCRDVQEPNNTAATAYGNIVRGAQISGGFCAAGDVDYYKFVITLNSTVLVSINNTGDTPLRARLDGGGQFAIVDVPAYSTGFVPLGSKPPGTEVTLKIEPIGPPGVEPDYSFAAFFGQDSGKRRRATR